MANFSKTAGTVLLAWTDIATGVVQVGSAVSVAALIEGSVWIRLARRTGSPFSGSTVVPKVRVEGSAQDSGNDAWASLFEFTPPTGSNLAATTLGGAVLASATSFTVASATSLTAGSVLFLGHSSSANYELVRVKSVSGTTVTPEEAVTYAHASGALVTNGAEIPTVYTASLASQKRLRAVVENHSSGQAIAVQVLLVTADAFNPS